MHRVFNCAAVIVQCDCKSLYQLRHRQGVSRLRAQQIDCLAVLRGLLLCLHHFDNWIGGD